MSAAVRAVMIDLDGTLVDTVDEIVHSANTMLAELGAAALPFATIRDFIGRGVPNLVRRSLDAAGLAQRVAPEQAERLFHRHYEALDGRLCRVFPGVLAGLEALRDEGYRLGCVTNKTGSLARIALQTTGLASFFGTLVAGDSLPQMKPAPEAMWHACGELSVAPADAVMVGDSAVDAQTARAAGMPVYIVSYGYSGPAGPAAIECDALIDSLEDLPGLIARRARRPPNSVQ